MVKIRIPATTANMGPGFDTLGMALKIYNELEIEESSSIELLQDGRPSPVEMEENLIYTSMLEVLKRYNFKFEGIKINLAKCDIPMSRGLGSSAACIAGGIAAANYLMGNILTLDDFVRLATEIEGHPDNVSPAILGGMVVSFKQGDNITYSKLNVPKELKFAVMIPNFRVSTESARKVLPDCYSREDCVYNVSRIAMLVSSLYNNDLSKLRECTKDRIHQPYRKALISNTDDIFKMAENLGSLAEFISGSGPTLIAVINKDSERFLKEMSNYLSTLDGEWKISLVEPDMEGLKML